MPETELRSLHLHTLDSLIADLVSGRPIQSGEGEKFALTDERTRSALEWYRKKGAMHWTASVTVQQAEDLVDAILLKPPELPALPARPMNANRRRLRLKKLEAHRFSGLHKFGTPDHAPEHYVHEFTSPLTLFEGRNGSGKTSLLNAIIWGLTGEMLRPQREPETPEDFECLIATAGGGDEQTAHKLSPLTPMPNTDQYRPDQPWVPADSWVELTFVDETGAELPRIRRSQSRTTQRKLKVTSPDLSVLGIDPIAARIGTVMPGLLPLIKVGSESELGRAVSQLTGLSALTDLAEHVRRAKTKIDKEFVKAKTEARDRADRDYKTAKDDLESILLAHANDAQLSRDAPLDVVDKNGGRAPIAKFADLLIAQREGCGTPLMDLWFAKPLAERRDQHEVTLQFAPLVDEPITLVQGALSYPLKKFTLVADVKVRLNPLEMKHSGYRDMGVAHGAAKLPVGSVVGQAVHFVITEQQGKFPKAALMLTGTTGSNDQVVRVAELNPGALVQLAQIPLK